MSTHSLKVLLLLVSLLTFPEGAFADTAHPPDTEQQLSETTVLATSSNLHPHRPRRRAGRRHVAARRDLAGNWFHVGGGMGAVLADPESPRSESAGRFLFGGGVYNLGLYGGGEMAVSGQPSSPLRLTAAGFFGLAPPLPVVHPMVGIRVGGGHHLRDGQFRPHFSVGPQAGFILRQFDGRPGLRMMVDAGIEHGFSEAKTQAEFFLSLAAVF